jgi:hypothetical protein
MNPLGRGKATRTGLRLAAAGLVAVGAGLLLTTSSVGATPTSTLGPVNEIPAPGGGGSFSSVSCTDATDCTAVGQDNDGQAIYATETAGVWGPVTEISAPGGGGTFYGVSCTDATDCTAVGEDGHVQPVFATETAGVWGPVTQISALGGYLGSVSCSDATDCTAVGQDGTFRLIYATETAGVWGSAHEIPAPGGGGFFAGVSCSDATDCTAVGEDSHGKAIYATETGGVWGPVTEISAPGGGGYFNGVSCSDATDCTAVGADYEGQPIYATETAGAWGPATEVTAPGGGGLFEGVSCTDATDCTAVGFDYNGQAVSATETAGVWGTPTEDPAPGGGGAFYGVSCSDATFCTAVGYDDNGEPIYTGDLALVADGSQVHAVIQVETSPAYAGDHVVISSSQLEASCGGTILFETLQGGLTTAPRRSFDSITVVLDDDGNVTVVVDGNDCAPGSDLIDADLTTAPYLTALTTLTVEPPQVTATGVSAYPNDEVETGNSATSGESDVYTVFYVETSPVYAEQPVTITSPQLEDRCGQGWRWEPGMGSAIDQTSGTTVATGTLDNDGNAVFVFKGASCAAGTSTVIADVDAGTHPTYTMTYSIGAPALTLASTMNVVATTRHHRHHRGPKGAGPGPDPPAMTVTASPNPLVETGEGTPAPPTTCGNCGG